MKNNQKNKEFPLYLARIRRDLVLQLHGLGLSMQDISDIFSIGITKGGVHKIIKKYKLTKAVQDPQRN